MEVALAALLVLALMSGRRTAGASSTRPAAGHEWVNPLPNLLAPDGTLYRPKVSDPYGREKRGGRGHLGVDMLWERKSLRDRPEFRPPRDGTPRFFAPPGVPVFAVAAGTIVSAKLTGRGYGVVIAHTGRGRWTFYQHLATLERPWRTGALVALGQQLGTMGFDPTGNAVRHLHFELWVWDATAKKRGKVDPQPELDRWPVISTVMLR